MSTLISLVGLLQETSRRFTQTKSNHIQYGSASESCNPATHDVSRVSYHVRHLETFAQALEDVCHSTTYRHAPDLKLIFARCGSRPIGHFPPPHLHSKGTLKSKLYFYIGPVTICSCCLSWRIWKNVFEKITVTTPISSPSQPRTPISN